MRFFTHAKFLEGKQSQKRSTHIAGPSLSIYKPVSLWCLAKDSSLANNLIRKPKFFKGHLCINDSNATHHWFSTCYLWIKEQAQVVFCPGLQKDSTVLPYDCLLHEGEGFCIFLQRLKVDFQVQVLRKSEKIYKPREQGLEISCCPVQAALHSRCNWSLSPWVWLKVTSVSFFSRYVAN